MPDQPPANDIPVADAGVKSALRVFEVLELFRAEQRPLRLKEVVARLGHPASSMTGLLKTMLAAGYLEHDQATRAYFPTVRLAHLVGWVPGAAFEGGPALAVFSGPHAYIAPGWYATQPAVPTWDYVAVHVHGVLEPVDDFAGTTEILRGLSAHDPAGFDMDALASDYLAGMLRGIRAFRLRSTRIEAQWKLSQNRSVADREGVIAGLRSEGQHATADLVAATLPATA